jgi:hypothetical protein
MPRSARRRCRDRRLWSPARWGRLDDGRPSA